MDQESHKLKKSLTNELHRQMLEIIGLGKEPLSANEIVQKSLKEHPSTTGKYVYEVIKELYRVDHLGQPHPERFLKVSYGENAKEKIRNIEAKEKDVYLRDWKIAQITSNPRNWRYSLNFKGFLLYLIGIHETHQVNKRTINTMMRNLSSYPDFEFLQYLDIFENEKVGLLIEIATEVQFQLKRLTLEDLRYYVISRCYKDISEWLSIEETIKKTTSGLVSWLIEEHYQLILELRNYKLIVVNELIEIEQKRLEDMMIDRMRTKQSLQQIGKS